ncbi:hypothetical protein LEP1GSC120_0610 [Leptospira santarosai str. 200702252]|nr:hypothetical protein LEP1GSC130_2188 [Leptospira santarosai str. 200403458]EMO97316.1 hypothetical protein LEP1GSC120_0610 [Leptospira santarosai str. 200702252]
MIQSGFSFGSPYKTGFRVVIGRKTAISCKDSILRSLPCILQRRLLVFDGLKIKKSGEHRSERTKFISF